MRIRSRVTDANTARNFFHKSFLAVARKVRGPLLIQQNDTWCMSFFLLEKHIPDFRILVVHEAVHVLGSRKTNASLIILCSRQDSNPE